MKLFDDPKVLHVRNNDPCRRKAMNPIDNFNAASADV
jgi:hypothetical protein